MKKWLALILAAVICLSLCACGSKMLSGTYESEDGYYSVSFEKDGTCTWYQDDLAFMGTYKAVGSNWQIEITGSMLYLSTVFQAREENGDLVISGGMVNEEGFTKK